MRLHHIFRGAMGASVIAATATTMLACNGGADDYSIYRVSLQQAELSVDCLEGGDPDDDGPWSQNDSTFEHGATFILYTSDDGRPYLEAGETVLPGSVDGEHRYRFEAHQVRTEIGNLHQILDTDGDGVRDMQDPEVDADGDGLEDRQYFANEEGDDEVDVDDDGLDDRWADDSVDVDGDGKDDRLMDEPQWLKDATVTRIVLELDGSSVDGVEVRMSERACDGPECPPTFDATCTTTRPFRGVEIDEADISVR